MVYDNCFSPQKNPLLVKTEISSLCSTSIKHIHTVIITFHPYQYLCFAATTLFQTNFQKQSDNIFNFHKTVSFLAFKILICLDTNLSTIKAFKRKEIVWIEEGLFENQYF